jgi:hypothetical protein
VDFGFGGLYRDPEARRGSLRSDGEVLGEPAEVRQR